MKLKHIIFLFFMPLFSGNALALPDTPSSSIPKMSCLEQWDAFNEANANLIFMPMPEAEQNILNSSLYNYQLQVDKVFNLYHWLANAKIMNPQEKELIKQYEQQYQWEYNDATKIGIKFLNQCDNIARKGYNTFAYKEKMSQYSLGVLSLKQQGFVMRHASWFVFFIVLTSITKGIYSFLVFKTKEKPIKI